MIINDIGINFAGGGGEPCTGGTCNLQSKSFTFNDNTVTSTTITPDRGYNGISGASVSVALDDRVIQIPTGTDLSYDISVHPRTGYVGLNKANISLNVLTTDFDASVTGNGNVTITVPQGYAAITGGTISVDVEATPTQAKSVTITSNTETEIVPDEGYVLSGVTVTTEIPPQPYSGYTYADWNNKTITALTQNDLAGFSQIKEYSYYFYANLKSADIPSNVTKIGQRGFCSAKLSALTINDLIEIDSEGISNAEFGRNLVGADKIVYQLSSSVLADAGLTGEYTFGPLLHTIQTTAFRNNTNLTSLVFQGSIGSIAGNSTNQSPFNNCSSLSAIDFTHCVTVPQKSSNKIINYPLQVKVPEYLYDKWTTHNGWTGETEVTFISSPNPSGYAESQIVYVIDSAGSQSSGFEHGAATGWQSETFDSESRTVTVTVYGPGVYWNAPNYYGHSFADKCNDLTDLTTFKDSSRVIESIIFPKNFKGFKVGETGNYPAFQRQPRNITFLNPEPPTIYGSLNVTYTDMSRCENIYVPAEALSAYQASTSITDTWLSAYTLTPIYATADVTFNIADNSSPVKVYDNYSGDLEYTVDSDPTVYSSTTYTFDSTGDHTLHFKLASTYRAKTPNRLFSGITEVTSAVLSDGVYETGANTFRGTSITALTANGLEVIGTSTFESCPTVTWSMIPAGITTINQKAFFNSGLSGAVNIPATVTSIGSSAFTNSAIQSLVFDNRNDVLDLSGSTTVFTGCQSLTGVTGTGSVNLSMVNAFSGCTSLTDFVWSGPLDNNIGHNIDERSLRNSFLRNCTSLTSVTLPDGLEKISAYAFGGCTSLTSIVIPASISQNTEYAKQIHDNSFNGSSISAITCYSTTEPLSVAASWSGMPATGVLYIPENADYSNWLSYLGEGWTSSTIPSE